MNRREEAGSAVQRALMSCMGPGAAEQLALAQVRVAWAEVVDDHNPLHTDPGFAATTRFGHPIAHGSLLFALVCDAIQQDAHQNEGQAGDLTVRFRAPVPLGSAVTVEHDDTAVRLRCHGQQPIEVSWSASPTAHRPKEDGP